MSEIGVAKGSEFERRVRKLARAMVEFRDLPRVATDSKDARDAMEEAIDALGSELSIRLSRREPIPAPSVLKRGQRPVPVPLWLAPKLTLFTAMRDQQVNNRIWLAVWACATKAERIQAALALLGKQMTVEVRDAA